MKALHFSIRSWVPLRPRQAAEREDRENFLLHHRRNFWNCSTGYIAMRTATSILLIVLVISVAGCGGSSAPAPPEGWTSADARWWQPDVDTSRAFRSLESLSAMGVGSRDTLFVASSRAAQAEASAEQLGFAVKQELIPLFRNQPRIMDSLFAEHVQPIVEKRLQQSRVILGSAGKVAEELKKESYQTISKRFREPRTTKKLGEDVPVPYPDSLRQADIGGKVEMQVYLNAEGDPQAVKLIEGVDPTLNDIAMQAATQMDWAPAYVLRDGQWQTVPSWTRFSVVFTP